MDIRDKFQQLQKRKRQRPLSNELNETSVLANVQNNNEQIDVVGVDENIEPGEVEAIDELIEFEVGPTNKGGIALWHEGYRYVKIHNNYFKCSTARCPSKAIIKSKENGWRGITKNQHNHATKQEQKEAEQLRAQGKQMAKTGCEPPKEILVQLQHGADAETLDAMGEPPALMQMLRRERKKDKKKYKKVDCQNPLQIDIPDELAFFEGEQICIFDSRDVRIDDPQVVMVFSHPTLMEILQTNKSWALDGTFKSAPKQWCQVFCISAFVNKSKSVMCAQALLPGKSSRFYAEALNALKSNGLAPRKTISDYEKSIIKAINQIFPEANTSGCIFHFGQSLFRKWMSLGLGPMMADRQIGKRIRFTFRSILALALINPIHVRRAFALIVDNTPPNVEPLKKFLMYFAEVYIGLNDVEKKLGIRAFEPHLSFHHRPPTLANSIVDQSPQNQPIRFGRPSPQPSTPSMPTTSAEEIAQQRWEIPIPHDSRPQYAIEFWNVNDRATKAIAKTNNSMEAAHQQFQRRLKHHPALSDFLRAFREDIKKQGVDAANAQIFPLKRRQKDVKREERVRQILGEIREDRVRLILGDPDFDQDDDGDLLKMVTLLGIIMRNYANGLRDPSFNNVEADRTLEEAGRTLEEAGRTLEDADRTLEDEEERMDSFFNEEDQNDYFNRDDLSAFLDEYERAEDQYEEEEVIATEEDQISQESNATFRPYQRRNGEYLHFDSPSIPSTSTARSN